MSAYIEQVRHELIKALCLHFFPDQKIERQTKPEIEMRTCLELILAPLLITRDGQDSASDLSVCCLIEQSINSSRISFRFYAEDPVEQELIHTYLRFMMHRCVVSYSSGQAAFVTTAAPTDKLMFRYMQS